MVWVQVLGIGFNVSVRVRVEVRRVMFETLLNIHGNSPLYSLNTTLTLSLSLTSTSTSTLTLILNPHPAGKKASKEKSKKS